jgi:hypothetical protein
MRITVIGINLTLYLFLFFIGEIQGQEKLKGFEIPSAYIKILLVVDPTCPIQLQGPTKVIGYDNGDVLLGYKMQNVSNTEVEKFSIMTFSWFGNSIYRVNFDRKEFFLPQLTYSSLNPDEEYNLSDFNKGKLKNFKFIEKIQDVRIVMITKVTLANGKIYDATSKYKEIEKFVDELDIGFEMNRDEIKMQENKLIFYIENLMNHKD